MLKLIKSDFYRLSKSRSVLVAILGSIALVALMVFSKTMIVSGLFDPDMQHKLEAMSNWGLSDMLMVCTIALTVFSWFTIPVYSVVVGQEFSQGTYKNVFVSGISRKDFVIGKFIVIASMCAIMLTIYYLSAALIGYFVGGMGSLPMNFEIVKSLLIAGLFFVTIMSVYFGVAMSLQISVNSVVIAIVAVVVGPFLIQIVQSVTSWEFLNAFSYAATSFESVAGTMTVASIITTLTINIAVLALCSVVSIYVTKKKEF